MLVAALLLGEAIWTYMREQAESHREFHLPSIGFV
jgi:hypothetical protein